MAEILTESFCERCGTRYTFESAPSKSRPLAALGTLGRGLKHFVASPENSLDESLAIARSEQEQRATNLQLEAFHQTFNFCLSCRQYTCADCWNPVEGRCLSCAPVPEAVADHVAAPAAFADLAVRGDVDVADRVDPDVDLRALNLEALDLGSLTEPAAVDEPIPLPDPEPEPEPIPPPLPEPEPLAAAMEAGPQAEPAQAVAEPVVVPAEPEVVWAQTETAWAASEPLESAAEPEAIEAAVAREPVESAAQPEPLDPAAEGAPAPGAFAPGRSLDDEIAAYELRVAALAEPVSELEPELASELASEPEPAHAAEREPDPELELELPPELELEQLPEPAPVPEHEHEPEPAPVAAEGPIAIPEPPGRAALRPAVGRPLSPDPSIAPHPAFVAGGNGSPAPIQALGNAAGSVAGRLAVPETPAEPGPPSTLATCSSCGLSLSASARFCRRCGTRQHE